MAAENSSNQGDLVSIERSVIMKSEEEHADELEVVDNALQHILEGFRIAEVFFGSKQEIEIQEGRMLMAVRVFKSLRSARILCERGYYEQSLALLRSSMEHLLVAYDIALCQETLDAVKSGSRLNVSKVRDEMLNRVAEISPDSNFKKNWNLVYQFLNEYVHAGGALRQQIPATDAVAGKALIFVSYYDTELVGYTLFCIEQNMLGRIPLVKEMVVAAGKNLDFQGISKELYLRHNARLSTF